MKTKIITAFVISTVGALLFGLGSYFQPHIRQIVQEFQWSSSNTPEIRGSQLKYKVIGASSVVFFTEVKYENSYYNYEYTLDVGDKTEGFLYMEPPPTRTKASIHITAISETGKRSEPLVFTNKEWWSRVTPFRNYAIEHTFTF